MSGWTSGTYTTPTGSVVPGYNFVFSSDARIDPYGGYGPATGAQLGDLSLWAKYSPTGASNGLTNAAGVAVSPNGGNFLAMDGAFEASAISQTITGLTVGMDTKVYFYYAGAQQEGDNGAEFNGATTEAFQVSLTDNTGTTPVTQSVKTGVLNNYDHGFTGWHYTYVDFVPTSTTETLSFLALGTPDGLPPFSLLDGVSIVQVTPEPSTLALLGTGVLAFGGMMRRRQIVSR